MKEMKVDLSTYDNSGFYPGRHKMICIFWLLINSIVMQNPLVLSSKIKIMLLKLFGAKIGRGVVIKQGINVKYPWNLEIGDFSWIGENVWLDSLDKIIIGNNVCVSQGAYLCTGNHDWSDFSFGLITRSIVIDSGAWIGAKATLLPGVNIASHSVVAAGSVVSKNTDPFWIYAGNPAHKVKKRVITDCSS